MNFFRTYRFLALFMSFLVFTTSTGWSLDVHYCEGKVQSVSLFGTAKPCHEKDNSSCSLNEQKCSLVKKKCCSAKKSSDFEPTLESKDCCQNELISLSQVKDIQQISSSWDLNINIWFAAAYVHSFVYPILEFKSSIFPHQNYTPPWLTRDIPVLVQSFLL